MTAQQNVTQPIQHAFHIANTTLNALIAVQTLTTFVKVIRKNILKLV